VESKLRPLLEAAEYLVSIQGTCTYALLLSNSTGYFWAVVSELAYPICIPPRIDVVATGIDVDVPLVDNRLTFVHLESSRVYSYILYLC